jgi:taurine dioxygenase
MEIQALTEHVGAEILGLDLRQELERDTLTELCDALYAHRVIVIREQKLTRDQYLAFGQQWGKPIPHVLDHMRMRRYPALLTVGNTEVRDREVKIRNGAALWHTDQSYEAEPASATMLYSLIAPTAGGETQFCDMRAAYQALPEAQRTQLDRYELAHKYGHGKRRTGELDVNPIINDDQDQRVPSVYHPLVLTHPIAGHKALYALGHGAHGVKGLAIDEADALIESLKDHVLQEQFIYRHAYQRGDLVIWDTLQTMHSATPIDVAKSRHTSRLLWRISVRGKPSVYQ